MAVTEAAVVFPPLPSTAVAVPLSAGIVLAIDSANMPPPQPTSR